MGIWDWADEYDWSMCTVVSRSKFWYSKPPKHVGRRDSSEEETGRRIDRLTQSIFSVKYGSWSSTVLNLPISLIIPLLSILLTASILFCLLRNWQVLWFDGYAYVHPLCLPFSLSTLLFDKCSNQFHFNCLCSQRASYLDRSRSGAGLPGLDSLSPLRNLHCKDATNGERSSITNLHEQGLFLRVCPF